MALALLPLTHNPFMSKYTSRSKSPVTCTVKYAAGIDCRKVEVGVIGDRKDKTTSSGSSDLEGDGIL